MIKTPDPLLKFCFFRVSVALVARVGMPGTRAQSRGKAAGGSCTSDRAAGNLPADVDPGLSADREVTNQQET